MRIVRVLVALALLTVGVGAVATPAADAYPAGNPATAIINATVFHRGDTATVEVKNARPGGVLTLTLASDPVVIAAGVVVGADGTASISGAIPAGTALGSHTVFAGSTNGETFTFSVFVVGDPTGPTGSFVYSCTGAGRAQFGFTGTGFDPRARYSLLVGSTVVATGRASSGVGHLEIYTETAFGPGDVAVSVVGAGLTYGGVLSDVQCGTSTPTVPPTSSPSPQPTGSPGGSGVVTVTATSSPAGSGTELASTGVQVGLGAGVGGLLLVGGTLLLLGARRRTGAHRH